MLKVIIAGSRNFSDFALLCQKMDNILSHQVKVEIVSGTANGADKLGERYAELRGYPVKRFPADWDDLSEPCIPMKSKSGKTFNALAGIKRNKQMAEYAEACVVFWDGKSTGTSDMIEKAKEHKLLLRIIRY